MIVVLVPHFERERASTYHSRIELPLRAIERLPNVTTTTTILPQRSDQTHGALSHYDRHGTNHLRAQPPSATAPSLQDRHQVKLADARRPRHEQGEKGIREPIDITVVYRHLRGHPAVAIESYWVARTQIPHHNAPIHSHRTLVQA
jgi:hypothetical protein